MIHTRLFQYGVKSWALLALLFLELHSEPFMFTVPSFKGQVSHSHKQ
jgi:hypothetical protein